MKSKINKFILALLVPFLSISCSSDSSEDGGGDGPKEGYYQNPVIRASVPDPTIIRTSDGTFYLYGTEDIRHMPIYRSTDMVNWKLTGTAFTEQTRPKFPAGSPKEEAYLWAPEIHVIKGKYVLFYSMNDGIDGWDSMIGYALSDSPEGPFTPKGIIMSSQEMQVKQSIDQFYYEEDGKQYMLWGSFNGLYMVELNVTDDLVITPKKETKQQVAGSAYEGSNLWKRDGYYYLFASIGAYGGGSNSKYQTVVGRSENLFGPYVNKTGGQMLDNRHEVVLTARVDKVIAGPGHNAILVEDDARQTWMMYHAYYTPWEGWNSGRNVCMDMVRWTDDKWPYINDGTPSASAEVPVINN